MASSSTLTALIAFGVYLATMPPSLTWRHFGIDGGDLATAIARGALPHPPGFPAFLIAGNFFRFLLIGDLAFRLNVMSAIFSAIAVGLIVATARRLNVAPLAAISAGLVIAFAPLFWSQAIIVEVYALASFFATFLLWLAARDAPIILRAFTLGIAAGAHPILIFYAPLVGKPDRFLKSLNLLISFLVGWFAMYAVVLSALNRALSPWTEIANIETWWAFVSAEIYRGYLFARPFAELPGYARDAAFTLARQFTPLGALIAILGLARVWRDRRAFTLAAMLAFVLITVFAITYNTFDSVVYLILVLPIAAIYFAFGLSALTHWLELRITNYELPITLLIPLLQLVLFWNEMNLHDDHAAIDWARATLRAAPPNAIVLTARDAHTFALWYARDALGERADMIVIDRDLWLDAPYRKMLMQQLDLPDDADAERAAQKMDRPVIWAQKSIDKNDEATH